MTSVAASSGDTAGGSSNSPSSRRPRDGRGRGRARGRGQQTGPRGGRSQGGRGRGAAGTTGAPNVPQNVPGASHEPTSAPASAGAGAGAETETRDEDTEAEVCFICASPVIHQSVAPCNHRTCHICALRMRALYKNKECAHCRTIAPYVIFTDDSTKRFQDYTDAAPDITSTDDNIGIRYTKEDIVGDTVLLLRYNCPDDSCDFAGLGWPDLHRHVRSVHHKKMCDLCTRNKKVFTHEHDLFTDKELEKHMRYGDDRPGAIDQTGFKGHPLCAFCGQRFYDDDKLYEHCRNKHERCFLCDRQDPRQPHYYLDYNALEQHFRKDHFLCPDRECQEKKFVVFASEMDLKAHQLSEHGNTLSKDVRRDARLVDMAGFDFRQPYQDERRGGGSGRGRGRDRDGRGGRGRDPNAEPIPASSAQPLRRDELVFQRQMAIHSSQSVSNRTFGGQLSSTAPTAYSSSANRAPASPLQNTTSPPAPSASAPSDMASLNLTDPNLSPEERARLVRHVSVIERASNLLQNDSNKMAIFRSQISLYRQGKVSASALLDSFFSLFAETSSTALGTLIREVADLFDNKARAEALRKAWNDWRAINEDYPTLPGLSGMHGATTPNSGWATAAASSPVVAAAAPAQRHTIRVLKLKSSTQQSQRSTAQRSANWAASASRGNSNSSLPSASTAAFPALPATNSRSGSGTSTPVRPSGPIAPAAPVTSLWGPNNHSAPTPNGLPGKSGSRDDNFPALPAAPKPNSLFPFSGGRTARDTGFTWGNQGSDSTTAPQDDGGQEAEGSSNSKGKKKGNKGKKKVLVQWG